MPPVLSALIFILVIVIMLLVGTALSESLGKSMVAGFIVVSALTEILIVPAVLRDTPVSVFTTVWWVVFGTMAALAAVYCRQRMAACIKNAAASFKRFFSDHKCCGVYGILANVLVLGQLAGSLLLTHYDDDDSAYITMVFSNVTDDRFMRIYSQTGYEAPLTEMAEYVTTGWYDFLSVIVKSTGIHPLILMRTLLPPLMIAMAYGIYYMLAKLLFEQEERRSIFMMFCGIINILGNVSTHTSSSVLLMRMHQGKAIFANIIIPVMFYMFLKLWDDDKNSRISACLTLFAVNTAACFFTTSGIAYGAMLTVVFCAILSFRKKSIEPFIVSSISVLPNVALSLVYVLERTRGIWQ